MRKETADKAAKWWADQLRGNAKLDTDKRNFGLATLLQALEKGYQDTEKINAFELQLSEDILESSPEQIIVEYNPDEFLQDVADKVGLDLGLTTLPWKTRMRIDAEKDTIKVYCHGSSLEEL